MEQQSMEKCNCYQDIDRMINEGAGGKSGNMVGNDQLLTPLEWPGKVKNPPVRTEKEEGTG